jgi:hypothetical protein
MAWRERARPITSPRRRGVPRRDGVTVVLARDRCARRTGTSHGAADGVTSRRPPPPRRGHEGRNRRTAGASEREGSWNARPTPKKVRASRGVENPCTSSGTPVQAFRATCVQARRGFSVLRNSKDLRQYPVGSNKNLPDGVSIVLARPHIRALTQGQRESTRAHQWRPRGPLLPRRHLTHHQQKGERTISHLDQAKGSRRS